MALRPARLTYDDHVLFPEDGQRHEIIDGGHYVSPAPTLKHQDVLLELAVALRSFIKANRLGKLYVAPADVVLSFYDVVQPDFHKTADLAAGAGDVLATPLLPGLEIRLAEIFA